MPTKIGFGFKRTSAAPIDEDLVLTKAQMLAADDTLMPSNYFCICKDDGKLYLYEKSNTVDENTGKYRVFEGGSSLPSGGTTGQVLAKKSDADGDVQWADVQGGGTPSGWGIAKSGVLQVPITNQRGDIVIPVDDLGLASGDDYNVALTIVGGGTGSWGDALTFLWGKSSTQANGSVMTTGTNVDRVDISYIVVAKGYGSKVSGWGIAKVGYVAVDFDNSAWSGVSTVDIRDLGLSSNTDYEVFVEQVGGGTLAAWGDSTAYVGSKSKDNFTVGAVKPEAVSGMLNVKYVVFAKGYGGGSGYDDTELRNAISTLERQKATGYFERTDFDIPLSTAGQPAFALAKDLFKIEVENHKPYTYEFTAGDVYNLAYYSETFGKTFIARNEDNETIHVKMTGPLPDNVTYTPVSSNPVLDFTNATATLTKTTFLKQIDEMLIPAASGEVFIFDVDGDNLTEDPDNPGGKHYGITLTSPTFEEIMDNLVANKLVFARILYNSGNSSEIYQLFRTSANSIRGKAFDLEFPQGYIWFYDIYVQKRNYETTTYFGVFADKVSDGGGGGGADFQIAHIPSGGGTGEEVKAILSKGDDSLSVDYYKNAELPDSVNLSVGDDAFIVPTTEYVDKKTGVFVLDADNPCSYNALQAAINAPKSVFVKFGGKFYPLVDKWENDEGSKRYVNLATLQRPTADKGVTYFFFEALVADLNSPMAYSSNYEQPYGKAYVDGKTGDLTTLTTDNKDNLVAAINEVYEKSGEPFRVKQWGNTFNIEIPCCTEDINNTAVPKTVFSIDADEGANYQIVGMIAYEVFDAASGGNRINCWPVCQFTGNGQKELSVRWMCAGTSRKTAKRISAWVLLKHR